MTIERSDKVYDNWRQATEKFDYFVLGLTGALCAYISQQYVPSRIAPNPATLELIALLVFILAAIAGFVRIEKTMLLTRLNHQHLRSKEERGSLMAAGPGTLMNHATGDVFTPEMVQEMIRQNSVLIPALRGKIEKLGDTADRVYHLRNWLILIGFLIEIIAKVWSAYV